MKRRDFIKAIAVAALAWPPTARAQQSTGARYIRALTEIKHDYGKISHPSEQARSDYITRLVRLREEAARLKTDAWQAIDAEIKQHPAPNPIAKIWRVFSSANGSHLGTIIFTGRTAPGQ
jgi:hypothetical protein